MTVNRITRTRRDRAKGPSLWHEVTGLGMLADACYTSGGPRVSVTVESDRAAPRDADHGRHSGREAQPLHHRRHELPVPGVPRAAAAQDDEGDADGRDLRPLPDDPADRARAEADPPVRRLRRSRRELPQRSSTTSTRRTARRCRPSWPSSWGWSGGWSRRSAWPSWRSPGFEADDIIATLTKVARGAGMDVVICSSDKDLTQLCTEDGGVAVLDTMKNRRIGPAEVREKFGVGPEQVGDVLALMGDSIDNVPGVAGIGPKTASELINKFGSLDALLAAAAAGGVPGKRGDRDPRGARGGARVARAGAAARGRAAAEDARRSCTGSTPTRSGCASCSRSWSSRAWSTSCRRRARRRSRRTPRARPRPSSRRSPRRSRRSRRRPACPRSRSARSWRRWPPRSARRARSGVAALYDGPSAVRSDLVGIAFAVGERRAYLPLTPPLPGRARVHSGGGGAGGAGAVARRRPTSRKHVHDAKTLEVLLLRRG